MTEQQKERVWQLVNHGPKNNEDWQLIRAYVKYHNNDGDLVNRICELETDIEEYISDLESATSEIKKLRKKIKKQEEEYNALEDHIAINIKSQNYKDTFNILEKKEANK